MRNLIRPIEKLEQRMRQRAKVASKSDPRCICYPERRRPEVNFSIQLEIAFAVKCPLHGDRFTLESNEMEIYTPKWLRKKKEKWTYDLSITYGGPGGFFAENYAGQYRKAHFAAFPPDLWAGVVLKGTEAEGEMTFLRLNDGTRIQVSGDTTETKRLLADLLKKRGQIVDLWPPVCRKEEDKEDMMSTKRQAGRCKGLTKKGKPCPKEEDKEDMMSTKRQAGRCKGLTKKGKPCPTAATPGGLCFFHANPDKASELGRIGGQKNRRSPVNAADFLSQLQTATDVGEMLDRIIPDIYAGQINPRIAAVLIPYFNLKLRAIESSEGAKRIAAIEKILDEERERREAQNSTNEE